MTNLLLIRHGQTDWNAAGRWQGHADIPLNETGQAQAQALAQRLTNWQIDTLYSSDLQRAAATAHIIGQHLGLSPILNPQWRERDLGEFEGLTSEEIQARFPHRLNGNGVIEPQQGEKFITVRERVAAAAETIIAQHPNQTVAIVSHGGVLFSYISHVLNIPPTHFAPFSLRGNTGLSIVQIKEGKGPYLLLLNDTTHLDRQPDLGSLTKQFMRQS